MLVKANDELYLDTDNIEYIYIRMSLETGG